MGYFSSFSDFLQMGGHALYVWLSYGIALFIIIYNIVSTWLIRRRFFIQARRRLRREKRLV